MLILLLSIIAICLVAKTFPSIFALAFWGTIGLILWAFLDSSLTAHGISYSDLVGFIVGSIFVMAVVGGIAYLAIKLANKIFNVK